LARTYRGWSNRDLARELGRDTHHLVPESGMPKLDIVIALAEALDWTVQDVVDDLCGNVPPGTKETPTETWADLDRAAYAALQKGEFEQAATLAKRAYFAASNGHERASACMREFGAWDGLGRYLLAMEACQRGLREEGRGLQLTITLRNNLANFHYLLGSFDESFGVSTATITLIGGRQLTGDVVRASLGFARYVRGNAMRAMMMSGSEWDAEDANTAIEDLRAASAILRESAEKLDAPLHRETAMIADGAQIAVEVMAGRLSIAEAMDRYLTFVDECVDPSMVGKLRLETVGWWSVFASEVAFAKIKDSDELERLLAIFTNKVNEVAAAIGNWAFRERVWSLELARREAAPHTSEEWVIDSEDARELSGAMARFPRFRAIGWKVFRSATIGDDG